MNNELFDTLTFVHGYIHKCAETGAFDECNIHPQLVLDRIEHQIKKIEHECNVNGLCEVGNKPLKLQ